MINNNLLAKIYKFFGHKHNCSCSKTHITICGDIPNTKTTNQTLPAIFCRPKLIHITIKKNIKLPKEELQNILKNEVIQEVINMLNEKNEYGQELVYIERKKFKQRVQALKDKNK